MVTAKAQNANIDKEAFAHTFSVVAKDTRTGEMAVAVQSHWFSVGSLVSWGKSGVGVVATQSFVNPAYGPNGLKLMGGGMSAKDALDELVSQDEGRDYRQIAFLDVKGNVAAYTGKLCVESAAHIEGENFSVQANMMLNNKVVPAMAEAFKANVDLPLAERMVEVLKAAQNAGGDIRGKQSAALIVVGPKKVENPWEEKKIDLRVDDHQNPIGDIDMALEEYGTAEEMFPENLEMKFWKAVALANSNRLEEALPVFAEIFEQDDNWREMITRLPKAGLLDLTEDEIDQITDL